MTYFLQVMPKLKKLCNKLLLPNVRVYYKNDSHYSTTEYSEMEQMHIKTNARRKQLKVVLFGNK